MTQGNSQSPLTKEDYATIQRLRDKLRHYIPFLENCQACGVPVDAAMATAQGTKQFIEAVEQHFPMPPGM